MVTVLLRIAAGADVFHTPDGIAYADVRVIGHRETLEIKGGFRAWLQQAYFHETAGGVGGEAMQTALATIEARAKFDGPVRAVTVRIAEHGDKLYLDLGDPEWRAVEVDADGWRIVAEPPVRFRRPGAMRALPVPERGGTIEELRPYVNVASGSDWTLLVAWTLAALRPSGPYPVLVVTGEQGSCKSTLVRVLCDLLDPRSYRERTAVKDNHDLAVAAENSHVVAFGNLSNLHQWQSDALCSLASGGGFTTREFFTTRGEAVFDFARPIILNGIGEFVTRPDLADRSVRLELEAMPDNKRQTEREFLLCFEALRPRILGALLDVVATGLRNQPHVRTERLPRMADFARWSIACEPAFGKPGAFLQAYEAMQGGFVAATIDDDPVAAGICKLARQADGWQGTAEALLKELVALNGDSRGTLPKSPRGLSDAVKRLQPVLRGAGIQVERRRAGGKLRARTIRLYGDPTD